MTKKASTPALRFKGFTYTWEQRKLSEFADKVTEKNVGLQYIETFTNSAEFGKMCIRDRYFDSACITILNGFQTSENLTVKDGDIVSIIKKGVMPPKEELESLMAARHTPKVHDTVKKARVAVCGLGGLGSNIAVMPVSYTHLRR